MSLKTDRLSKISKAKMIRTEHITELKPIIDIQKFPKAKLVIEKYAINAKE
jgi:hypothetical protein